MVVMNLHHLFLIKQCHHNFSDLLLTCHQKWCQNIFLNTPAQGFFHCFFVPPMPFPFLICDPAEPHILIYNISAAIPTQYLHFYFCGADPFIQVREIQDV